jgi:TatD DNase family protein
MPWVDAHCHLPYEGVGAEQVAAARGAGVVRIVTIGTNRQESLRAIELAGALDEVWATVGLHPHDAVDGVGTIADLLDRPRVVAVGECGLDYHYDNSPRDVQREAFAAQVELAHAHDLALVIHTRSAWDDTFAVLGEVGMPDRTVIHCFSGGPVEARRSLDLGAHLSFSGIVTFKNAGDVRDAAAMCPLDRLLVETDAPFLTPVPHRGRPNSPVHIPLIGAAVAAAKGLPVERIRDATWDTTRRLFGLPGGSSGI